MKTNKKTLGLGLLLLSILSLSSCKKETVETTHNINNFDIKELFKVDKDT